MDGTTAHHLLLTDAVMESIYSINSAPPPLKRAVPSDLRWGSGCSLDAVVSQLDPCHEVEFELAQSIRLQTAFNETLSAIELQRCTPGAFQRAQSLLGVKEGWPGAERFLSLGFEGRVAFENHQGGLCVRTRLCWAVAFGKSGLNLQKRQKIGLSECLRCPNRISLEGL